MPISIYRTRPAVVEAVRWGTEDPATVWNWLEAHGCPWLDRISTRLNSSHHNLSRIAT